MFGVWAVECVGICLLIITVSLKLRLVRARLASCIPPRALQVVFCCFRKKCCNLLQSYTLHFDFHLLDLALIVSLTLALTLIRP
jgi:hypothetical protein